MDHEFPELLNHWYAVCKSHNLRQKPLAYTLLGQPLVLFRTQVGVTALMDRCPHRNVPLSSGWVAHNQIVCPYHGWQFDTTGQCQAVPGLCAPAQDPLNPNLPARRVKQYPVKEENGLIWVFAGDSPVSNPPHFPQMAVPGYSHFIAKVSMQGSLPDALENFLDGTHTHFVHAGLIRTEGHRKRTTAIVRRKGDTVEAQYPDEGQQSGLISRLFGAGIDNVYGRFRLPSLAELEYQARGRTRLLITLCFTPTTQDNLDILAVVIGQAPSQLTALAAPLLKFFFWQAFRQDRQIVELQLANRKRFGGEQYTYTELDLLRPHIVRLLKHGAFPTGDHFEERVQMYL